MGKWMDFFLDPDYESVTSGPEKYELVIKARLDGGSNVVKRPIDPKLGRPRKWYE